MTPVPFSTTPSSPQAPAALPRHGASVAKSPTAAAGVNRGGGASRADRRSATAADKADPFGSVLAAAQDDARAATGSVAHARAEGPQTRASAGGEDDLAHAVAAPYGPGPQDSQQPPLVPASWLWLAVENSPLSGGGQHAGSVGDEPDGGGTVADGIDIGAGASLGPSNAGGMNLPPGGAEGAPTVAAVNDPTRNQPAATLVAAGSPSMTPAAAEERPHGSSIARADTTSEPVGTANELPAVGSASAGANGAGEGKSAEEESTPGEHPGRGSELHASARTQVPAPPSNGPTVPPGGSQGDRPAGSPAPPVADMTDVANTSTFATSAVGSVQTGAAGASERADLGVGDAAARMAAHDPSVNGGVAPAPVPAHPMTHPVAATPPPEAATLPPAVGEQVMSQLVSSLKMQWKDGIGEATMQLRPDALGAVTVSLRVDHGAVTAVVRAESAQVQEWVLQHQQSLRQHMEAAGLRLDDLSVNPDDRGQRQQREDASQQQHRRRPPLRHDDSFERSTFELLA